jgi:hypothetical protein
MYSFNKVSDLYSTANSDPQAWEFRHPQFRRDEPELFAQIKRKPARANQTDPQVMASPGDDRERPVSGWGLPQHQNYRYASPPSAQHSYYQAAQAHPPPPRPMSSDYDQPVSRSPPRPYVPPPTVVNRPSTHAGYPIHDNRERTYFSQSQPPPPPSRHHSSTAEMTLSALSAQIHSLQSSVDTLTSTLNRERFDRLCSNLEVNNYILRLVEGDAKCEFQNKL